MARDGASPEKIALACSIRLDGIRQLIEGEERQAAAGAYETN